MLRPFAPFAALILLCSPSRAQQVEVESFVLDNGMEFLLVPRSDQPNSIAAGWVAKVGSVNERPGITGISHFFEHMMFKGSHTIGTRDPVADREIIDELAEVRDKLLALQAGEQYSRYFAGAIDDPWDAAHDTPQMAALRERMRELMDQQHELIVKDEFDQIYTRQGGSGMNAFTNEDLTFYFITVPSNKFELWAWMESDRLQNSVFREFYAERDVVHEERRLRTESTPTGIFQEQFNAMFWQSSPYSWPVIGWISDLNSYTRKEAEAYYSTYYRPNNLVGMVVGDFEPEAVKKEIRRYFSRLVRGSAPPPVVTLEMPQVAEKRMNAAGDCQPQVEVRYHTVAFDHMDSFALSVLSSILNGRTGRLYKSLVEGQEVASFASAGSDNRKYGGFFSFRAECKGEATPEDLETGWYEVLAEVQEQPIPERELQKVKNQAAANSYRRLQSNLFLLIQLGLYEARGGWEYLNESPAKLQAVTAEDVQRVAKEYFAPENRSVATYTRKEGLAPEDPALAALGEQARAMVKQMTAQFETLQDVEQLVTIKGRLEGQMSQAPEEAQAALQYMVQWMEKRIETLRSSSGN